MPDPIKSKIFQTKDGYYEVNFVNTDNNKTNWEHIQLVKRDKNMNKIGDTFEVTGLNLINESCPIAGMENKPVVFAKDGSGRDNHGATVKSNIITIQSKGFSDQIDNEAMATYLNNSFEEPENNTKFEKIPYAYSDNTGFISKRQKADGTTEQYYTSTLFKLRKNPKENDVTETIIPNK